MEKVYEVVSRDALNKLLNHIDQSFAPASHDFRLGVNRALVKNRGVVIYLKIIAGEHKISWSTIEEYKNSYSKDSQDFIKVSLFNGALWFKDCVYGESVQPVAEEAGEIRPNYYKKDGRDLFDYFADLFPEEGFRGFMRGNVFKYLMRYPAKNGIEDLVKARTYIDRLIQFEKSNSKS